MKEILLSKPVCGCCGYFGSFSNDHGCSLFKMGEVYARDVACKKFAPKIPIKVYIEEDKCLMPQDSSKITE